MLLLLKDTALDFADYSTPEKLCFPVDISPRIRDLHPTNHSTLLTNLFIVCKISFDILQARYDVQVSKNSKLRQCLPDVGRVTSLGPRSVLSGLKKTLNRF